MYQNPILVSRRKLLIIDAHGLCVPKSTCIYVSPSPAENGWTVFLKRCKGNLNWGIKAWVFDLPRTCASPITWVLFLMTQVGMKPAVKRVPKAPSGMSLLLPSPFFPPRLKPLPVYAYLSHVFEATLALITAIISLFCSRGLCPRLSNISVRISMLLFPSYNSLTSILNSSLDHIHDSLI